MLDGSHAANSQAKEKPPEDVTPPSTDNVVDNTDAALFLEYCLSLLLLSVCF